MNLSRGRKKFKSLWCLQGPTWSGPCYPSDLSLSASPTAFFTLANLDFLLLLKHGRYSLPQAFARTVPSAWNTLPQMPWWPTSSCPLGLCANITPSTWFEDVTYPYLAVLFIGIFFLPSITPHTFLIVYDYYLPSPYTSENINSRRAGLIHWHISRAENSVCLA